jgi:hypothetical protein
MQDQSTKDTSGAETPAARAAINTLAQYSTFPAYPTSFIVATDTIIEVSIVFAFWFQ